MKKKRFQAEIQAGHKDDAVEVPFDPADVWGLPPQPLWRGRRGHAVQGTLNGSRFEESFIVPRQKKFFMVLDRDLQQAAGVSAGDSVKLVVEPKQN